MEKHLSDAKAMPSGRACAGSAGETSRRLQICVGSVLRLIRMSILPATQLMPSAPWQVPVAALESEAVKSDAYQEVDVDNGCISKIQDNILDYQFQ